MQRQRGQSAVEFALMAPIIFFMIFGMIFGGIMFMEYMHYSNAVRTAARQVAVTEESKRDEVATSQKEWLEELWEKEVTVKLYKPHAKITFEDNSEANSTDVVVNVTFERSDDIPHILYALDFPPKSIKALQYKMKWEQHSTTEGEST